MGMVNITVTNQILEILNVNIDFNKETVILCNFISDSKRFLVLDNAQKTSTNNETIKVISKIL